MKGEAQTHHHYTVPSSATVEKGPSTDLHEGSVGWACTGEGLPGG